MEKSVVTVIFNKDRSSVLLVKRRDVSAWVLPGGGIDPEETPAEAALRESFEETGLRVIITRLVAEYTPLNRLARQTYLFECQENGGNLAIGAETRNAAFFPLGALPDKLFFLHREWINDTLLNKKDIIHRPLNNVTYLRLFVYFLRHPLDTIRMVLSRFGMPINSK